MLLVSSDAFSFEISICCLIMEFVDIALVYYSAEIFD